jgi:hypothetical protein
MPISTSSGKRLLKATKEAEARALAVRTAEAVDRYLSSTSSTNEIDRDIYYSDQEEAQVSFPGGSGHWTRHNFATSTTVAFSRSNGELLTIRKAPEGDGWIILYDEPEDNYPE